MSYIEERTTWRFTERTSEEKYVRFIAGNGCFATIGRHLQLSNHDVSLSDNCGRMGAVHEVLHVLGLFHEHQR